MADLDDIPTQDEYATWRNRIAVQKEPGGGAPVWNPGQLIVAVGTTVDGRTWREINQGLADYLRSAVARQGARKRRLIMELSPDQRAWIEDRT